jgi:hypothetical protein
MLRIQEQHREDFMLEAGQLGAQVLLDRRRRSERRTALHLVLDGLARGFQNLVGRRRQVAPCASRTISEASNEEKDSCDMIVLRLLGRNCPEPWPARRSASSQGSQTAARTQACMRAALDGENAVIR